MIFKCPRKFVVISAVFYYTHFAIRRSGRTWSLRLVLASLAAWSSVGAQTNGIDPKVSVPPVQQRRTVPATPVPYTMPELVNAANIIEGRLANPWVDIAERQPYPRDSIAQVVRT